MKLLRFFLIWYSQNLAIPFWIIGHVHLSLNNYHDLIEITSSIMMHIAVAVGFYLDWTDHKNK